MPGSTIGHDVETGKPVVIEDDDRQRGLYVIGTTGTGKTTLLENLALQDINNGLGVCVLDPHGDLISRILTQLPDERANDVVLLDPRDAAFPFGLNPYWCEDPNDSELVGRQAAQVHELFEKLWGAEGSEGSSWGPRVAQYMRNTAFTLLANPGLSMADIPALLSDAELRANLVPNVRNPQVRLFWKDYEALRPQDRHLRTESTLNKLDEFLTQPIVANIVGQSRPTVDFRRFMDEGKIVLVPLGLGRLGDPVVSLLGSLMTLQILNAALSREDQPVRRQFNLYADEYQRFATPAFATLLTEARKYGVATTIAHQTRSQLDPQTRAAALNAGSLVVFAVHGEDAEELAKQFDRTPPEPGAPGRRQKQSISQTPTAFLARNGHQDPEVRRIIADWLGELVNNATTLPENGRMWFRRPEPSWNSQPYFADKGGYYASKATLAAGLRLIDSYLVPWMEKDIDWSTIRDRLVAILVQLRAFFCIAPFETPVFGERLPDNGEYLTQHVVPVPWLTEMGEAELKWMALAALTGDSDTPHLTGAFGVERRVFWESYMESLMGWSEPEQRREPAQSRAQFEALQADRLLRDLVLLGSHLYSEPILVESGQWETIPERPRAFSDVREEIANELVKQPQFRAVCRIPLRGAPAEFRIRTPSFVVLDEAHSFTDVEAIRQRSREHYAVPRAEVERAMVERLLGDRNGHSRRVDLDETGGDSEEAK